MLSPTDLSPRGYGYFVFNIITPIFASLAVFIRVWVRLFISRSFGLEDSLLLCSLFCFVAQSAAGVVMSLNGLGAHIDTVSIEHLTTLYKWMYAASILVYLSIITLRISLCLLFLRITQVPWQRRALYCIAAVSIIINIINLFYINLFYCKPISYFWNFVIATETATCVDVHIMNKLLYVQYSVATAADWLSSLLPIFIMKDWVRNKRAKYATYALLGMGIFASGGSIAAIVSISRASNSADLTYTTFGLFIGQVAEPLIGIVAASLSTYRPLFRWLNVSIKAQSQKLSSKVSDRTTDDSKRSTNADMSASSQGGSYNSESILHSKGGEKQDEGIGLSLSYADV